MAAGVIARWRVLPYVDNPHATEIAQRSAPLRD